MNHQSGYIKTLYTAYGAFSSQPIASVTSFSVKVVTASNKSITDWEDLVFSALGFSALRLGFLLSFRKHDTIGVKDKG